MRTPFRITLGMCGFALLAVAIGCGKGSTGSSTPTGPSPTPAPSVGGSGAQVFATMDCGKCHATEAGGGRKQGPNLFTVSSKPGRDLDWIMAHIKNPKTHSPMSRMPNYEGKISDADLKALAEYLIGLK